MTTIKKAPTNLNDWNSIMSFLSDVSSSDDIDTILEQTKTCTAEQLTALLHISMFAARTSRKVTLELYDIDIINRLPDYFKIGNSINFKRVSTIGHAVLSVSEDEDYTTKAHEAYFKSIGGAEDIRNYRDGTVKSTNKDIRNNILIEWRNKFRDVDTDDYRLIFLKLFNFNSITDESTKLRLISLVKDIKLRRSLWEALNSMAPNSFIDPSTIDFGLKIPKIVRVTANFATRSSNAMKRKSEEASEIEADASKMQVENYELNDYPATEVKEADQVLSSVGIGFAKDDDSADEKASQITTSREITSSSLAPRSVKSKRSKLT